MTNAQRERRVQAERRKPESWWFLSFANATGFLGGAFIRARGPWSALQRADDLGITPAHHGEFQPQPLTDEEIDVHVPNRMRNRLLSERQVWKLGGM